MRRNGVRLKRLENALATSQQNATRIFEYVDARIGKLPDIKERDHFAFVSLSFLHKQMAHARSVNVLLESGLASDASVIARVMLEGLIYVSWMFQKADERAKKYREHALVSDYRTLLRKEADGTPVPEAQKHKVTSRLSELGSNHLKPEKGSQKHGKKNDTDPYQGTWMYDDKGTKITISMMTEALGDKQLKSLYDELSQWSHWTVKGIGRALVWDAQSVRLNSNNVHDAILSCQAVIMALTGTAIAVSAHLKLGMEDQLDSMRTSFVQDLKESE